MCIRDRCSTSPTLFNLHLDNAVREWMQRLEILNFSDSLSGLNLVKSLMFAGDQVIIADNEKSLQRVLYKLQQIIKMCDLEISVIGKKSMAFKCYFPVRCKLELNHQLIRKVHTFRFL